VDHVAKEAADRQAPLDAMEDHLKKEQVTIGLSDAQTRRLLEEAKAMHKDQKAELEGSGKSVINSIFEWRASVSMRKR